MSTWTGEQISGFIGEKVVDDQGHPVGTVMQISDRPGTLDPEWLVVKTSRFGKESLVPLEAVEETTSEDQVVHVPFSKTTVRSAPHPMSPLSLSDRERDDLMRYYQETH
jgi:hypothetical protein